MLAIPEIKALAAKYGAQGLVVVAPSLDAEAEVRTFRAQHKIDYAVLSDAGPAAKSYMVRSYPTMYLVGRDRKVLWQGGHKDNTLIAALEAALKAPAPEPTGAAAAAAKAPVTVYVLKDGRRIRAQTAIDAGEEYSIKDDAGKFHLIKKSDVAEVVKE